MSIERVKQIAREKYGKELTDEQATKYAEKYGKLLDNELDNISGGYNCGDGEYFSGKYCETCGVWCDRSGLFGGNFECPVCGTTYR